MPTASETGQINLDRLVNAFVRGHCNGLMAWLSGVEICLFLWNMAALLSTARAVGEPSTLLSPSMVLGIANAHANIIPVPDYGYVLLTVLRKSTPNQRFTRDDFRTGQSVRLKGHGHGRDSASDTLRPMLGNGRYPTAPAPQTNDLRRAKTQQNT